MISKSIVISFALFSICMLFSACQKEKQERANLTISAAISLKDALEEIQVMYGKSHPNVTLIYNFGSSGALQQQIENGAPVDIFFSAAVQQMDELENNGFLLARTRSNLLTNRLVVITPLDNNAITGINDLTKSNITKIAIGEPNSVPVGSYAREAFTSLGILQAIQSKLILAKDARQVLTYVETGNVDAGIVYASDVLKSSNVKVITMLDDSTHSPIIYPVAVLQQSQLVVEANAFVMFLGSDSAKPVFIRHGFQFNTR